MKDKIQLLKVLVGSRAHGLATPESDYDFRGVFTVPTVEFFKVFPSIKETNWIEGEIDNTSWELSHFLKMATKCNPTILETFLAPVEETTPIGEDLRALFPYVWNSDDVKNAFIGYGLNQRKKFLEKKDNRSEKYAVAYLRTLIQAEELLRTGTFSVDMSKSSEFETLKRWKGGDCEPGEVIQKCVEWERDVLAAWADSPKKETDMAKVDEFLLAVRKYYL